MGLFHYGWEAFSNFYTKLHPNRLKNNNVIAKSLEVILSTQLMVLEWNRRCNHVISISGSVVQLSAGNLMNTAKYCTMRRPKAKRISASRGLYPQTSWPGALPLDRAGALSPDPHYRLELPCSPYLDAPLKFVLALGLKFWRRCCIYQYVVVKQVTWQNMDGSLRSRRPRRMIDGVCGTVMGYIVVWGVLTVPRMFF